MKITTFVMLFILFNQILFAQDRKDELGKIVRKSIDSGSFYQYVPPKYKKPVEFIVFTHGSLRDEKQDASEVAEYYVKTLQPMVNLAGVILIVPIFDQYNYGGYSGPLGGYRGCEGRTIGADVFVNQIMDGYKEQIKSYDGKFHLMGHSAGGQFTCSYISKHPERIKTATLIAPGVFMFFDEKIPFPYGIGRGYWGMDWPGAKETTYDYTPDSNKLNMMVQLPILVVAGEKDISHKDSLDGQIGDTRLARAQSWVVELKKYAQKIGVESKVEFSLVKGAGHNDHSLFKTAWNRVFKTKIKVEIGNVISVKKIKIYRRL